jgi:hypothetical protein
MHRPLFPHIRDYIPYAIFMIFLVFLDNLTAYYDFYNPFIHDIFLKSEVNRRFINALLEGNIIHFELRDVLENLLIILIIYGFIYHNGPFMMLLYNRVHLYKKVLKSIMYLVFHVIYISIAVARIFAILSNVIIAFYGLNKYLPE